MPLVESIVAFFGWESCFFRELLRELSKLDLLLGGVVNADFALSAFLADGLGNLLPLFRGGLRNDRGRFGLSSSLFVIVGELAEETEKEASSTKGVDADNQGDENRE